ncbi:retrovirus-related Pol polyprotein from transposon 412 [Trichonephila clavipes]|nr:retrovirus-related Pol polyprotein from transposon 412 [Trichonephila clavipes]
MIAFVYFVDGLKDEEIQRAFRISDVQYFKSALLYALKFEAKCIDRHFIQGARGTGDAPCESPWRKQIRKLKMEIQDLTAQHFLHLRNGVLYRKWESNDRKTFRRQLILPKIRASTVLKKLIGSPTEGYFSVMKTLQKVREHSYWNNVLSDMEKCCCICDPCAARKGSRKRNRGRMQLYNVGAPLERIAFDILCPLQRS